MFYTLIYDGVEYKHEYSNIDHATIKNTPYFIPMFKTCRVLSVYDGDTVTIAGYVQNSLYKFRVRLYGIDAPEMPTESGIKSRDYLRFLILDKNISIDIKGYDKYGRLLAKLECDIGDVSDNLIKTGYAKPYFGKGEKPY